MRTADAVIAYSHFVEEDLKLNGVEKTSVIPLFVKVDNENSEMFDPVAGKLLFVGRLTRYKGLHVLLDALRQVDASLVVCGAGRELSSMEKLTAELGLQARVAFRGWRTPDQLESEYRQAAAVIVPSVWPEPFGLVGLEAMRHRRPVIGSNTGGIPDWLEDGHNGLLFSPGDSQGLTDAMSTLLRNPAYAADLGSNGHQRLLAEFSPAAHISALLRVYGDLGWADADQRVVDSECN